MSTRATSPPTSRRSRPKTPASRSSTARRRSSSRARGWFGRFVAEATGFDWSMAAFPGADLSLGSSGNLWVVPENASNKDLAYEFIDITMRPEIQAIIGNNVGVSPSRRTPPTSPTRRARPSSRRSTGSSTPTASRSTGLARARLLRRDRAGAAGPRHRRAGRRDHEQEPRRAVSTKAPPTSVDRPRGRHPRRTPPPASPGG